MGWCLVKGVLCKNNLAVLSTEWLPWLQTSWRDYHYCWFQQTSWRDYHYCWFQLSLNTEAACTQSLTSISGSDSFVADNKSCSWFNYMWKWTMNNQLTDVQRELKSTVWEVSLKWELNCTKQPQKQLFSSPYNHNTQTTSKHLWRSHYKCPSKLQ